jgi:hypothetical protein
LSNSNLLILISKAKRKDKVALTQLVEKFNPLLIHYAKKLYNVEFDDAKQELSILLIESIYAIERYNHVNECLAFIKLYVHRGFCKLYQKSKRKYIEFTEFNDDVLNRLCSDNISDVDTFIDFNHVIHKQPLKIQKIIILSCLGYTDHDISIQMHLSKQYVNRVKKRIF